MRETLPKALSLMFGDEGGYVNRKTDAGGPTKYGITQRTLSADLGRPASIEDVRNLTPDRAEAIYRKSFWAQSGGDLLPAGLDYAVFTASVMSGPARGVKILQQLVGVAADGIVGVQTVDAVRRYGAIDKLIRAYCDAYMAYLRSIPGPQGFGPNGRGWTIRITGKDPKGQWKAQPGVVGHALALAAAAQPFASDKKIEPSEPPADPVVADAMSAKAVQPPAKPLTDPTVIVTTVTAGTGVLSALSGISGPIAWAVAAVIVGGALFVGIRYWRTVREAESSA
ncbi:glycoside hydrolase family 108 protein [Kaistia sp. UC242_56]|uniref:glycoside hydrolase family 108 protein n=1 Tax=Kaistia sp. UC242_56 TaxID=3374625 RepID=UPI0037B92DF8